MSDFEFVFSLFGLLLGFSLVEVLGGLARVIEAQLRAARVGAETPGAAPFRAGWLTPLLGLFIMLDVISFWGSAWVARGELVYSGRVAMGGLVFAGAYYVAAHLVFPTEKADWADLDAHYFRVRRAVFGTMIALTILQTAFMLTVPGVARAMADPIVLGSAGFHSVMIVAAMLAPGRKAGILILSLLSLRYVFQYLS